jgi:hypothetical protein
MNKEIINTNDKGKFHGYNEISSPTTMKLLYRGNWKNNEEIGYLENHLFKLTYFYIK